MQTNDILRAALVGFDEQRAKITAQMRDIEAQLTTGGPQQGPLPAAGDTSHPATIEAIGKAPWEVRTKRHTMSAEGRARIAAAQRKRWKLAKKAKASAA